VNPPIDDSLQTLRLNTEQDGDREANNKWNAYNCQEVIYHRLIERNLPLERADWFHYNACTVSQGHPFRTRIHPLLCLGQLGPVFVVGAG
jgi:hypothetical protein